jgi:hypothetical protein
MKTVSTHGLHFRDSRPPHQVQFALEREIRTLFTHTTEHDKLCLRAKANVVGADYDLLLRFEAALPSYNCYLFRLDVSCGDNASSHEDYYRKTSASWFKLWTSEFKVANPPAAGEGSSQRYHQLSEEALKSEQQFDSIVAIQQAIIVSIKRGARFGTAHKEGGTNIYWKNSRFVRSDYGDYPDEQQFTDEIDFLKMLRQFCHSDVTRNSGKDQLSEIDTWRLIMRRMDPK